MNDNRLTAEEKADIAASGEVRKLAIGLAVHEGKARGVSVRAACTGLAQAAIDVMAAKGHTADEIAGWLRGLARGLEMRAGTTPRVN